MNVSAEDLVAQAGANWTSYNGDYTGRRYSSLREINPQNVAQLRASWVFHPGNSQLLEVTPVVVNGIMYVLSTGCAWRYVPKDLPPRSTLHGYLDRWSYDGTLEKIHHTLYVKCREQAGREASPTAAVIDSQSVKSAEKGGPVLIRMVTMQARRSRARSGIFSSIH